MFELKALSKEGIPKALDKAKHYRLLNEPEQAESICRDILTVDPKHQETLVVLLLALTDQFEKRPDIRPARELLSRLQGAYERLYYEAIIYERQGRATLHRGGAGSEFVAYELFLKAMALFEDAEKIHPPGNDDPVLRWNACARAIKDNRLQPGPEDILEHPLE